MDSIRHPDLVDVGRGLRAMHDAVLNAEQAAAAVFERRRRTLWDLFVEWEDIGASIVVGTTAGEVRGRPDVGADHVLVAGVAVPFDAVLSARRL